jgi:solute carrier family 25 folate transporter 32
MLTLFQSKDGLSTIVRKEGTLGLFRGTSLALFGVSNGAIQFMAYEKMKAWGFDRKRKQYERAGKEYIMEADKLVCVFNCAN